MAKRKISAKQKHEQKIRLKQQHERIQKEQQKAQAKAEKKARQRAQKQAEREAKEKSIKRKKVSRETKSEALTAKQKKQKKSAEHAQQRKDKLKRIKQEQRERKAQKQKQQEQQQQPKSKRVPTDEEDEEQRRKAQEDEELAEAKILLYRVEHAIDDHTQGEARMAQILLSILNDARNDLGETQLAQNLKDADEETISYVQETLKYKVDSENGQRRINEFYKMCFSRLPNAYESRLYAEWSDEDDYVNDPYNYGDDFGYASTADID